MSEPTITAESQAPYWLAITAIVVVVTLGTYSVSMRLDEQILLRQQSNQLQEKMVDRLELIHNGQMRAYDSWQRTWGQYDPRDIIRPGWKPGDPLGQPQPPVGLAGPNEPDETEAE